MIRIPPELLEYKQWVLWRRAEGNGRVTKLPISPWSGKAASGDKPQTWSSYQHVRYALYRYRCQGIGFVFTREDPFCGIDLDHCRAPNGILAPEARELIGRSGSYTELSPSGTGVHILLKASLPGKGRRSGNLELYDAGRYFTVTGRHLAGTPFAIENRQETLDQLHAECFPTARTRASPVPAAPVQLSDEELIRRAGNGSCGDRFQRLWAGDASDYAKDHSRADLALCHALACWAGEDTERIDRLFRHSGLMRDKWDRPTGDSTCGRLTIAAAITGPHRR